MATPAQIAANQANSKLSTGAKSAQGKATVSQNNFRHGFTGAFKVLPWEDAQAFEAVRTDFRAQHQPTNAFETTLVEKMAQHYWLAQRALSLQDSCFNPKTPACDQEKQLALYLRYHTTHDCAFYKCLRELRKLREEKRKAEIGFVSQEHKRNQEARRQEDADRKRELHKWRVLQLQIELAPQEIVNGNIPPEAWDLVNGIRRMEAAAKAA